MSEHMSLLPAAELSAEERAEVEQAEAVMQAAPPTPAEVRKAAPPTKVVKLKGGAAVPIDNAVSRMGPSVPAAWSESKMVLPEFHELPDVLKKARLDNNERRRRASELHDQLAEGIEDRYLRRDVVQEIVELMDIVTASYDAEREYVLSGATPQLSPDMREQYDRLEVWQLGDVLTNKLRPRVSYWKRQCKLRDGDALVEAKLRQQEAEHEVSLAHDLYQQKKAAHQRELAAKEQQREAKKTKR
jgi:hypothetical protein